MRYEKIIKREDGSKVKIVVDMLCDSGDKMPRFRFNCYHCAPRKRTWMTPVNHDDYSWRQLGWEERDAEDRRRKLTLATEDDVRETMRELLRKIQDEVESIP